MHILFLSDNFPPEVNAPAGRTFEHCREWVKAGHQVTVITCAPNFPKGRVFGGYRNRLWQSADMEGIRVIRVWSYITRNEGFAKRILDYLSYMITSFVAALFVRRVDIIVATSPQFFTACAGWAVSVVKWRPWVFELRDIWPESIRAVSAMKASRALDVLEKVELFLYRRATAIVSVTHSFKENLIQRGIEGNKIHVVTNGVDIQQFFPRPKDTELEATLGLQGKFVAGYIGTQGMAHGLDTLLDAATLLRNTVGGDAFHIVMLGDGASRVALQKRAQEEGLSAVLFVDTVPKADVARYWSLLDASIIHLKKNDLFSTVIPSKLFECMAMGTPVLHGVEGESARILTEADAGLLFQPENAEALVAGLVRLRDDAELAARLRRNGPVAAQKYDRNALASDMLRLLQTLGGEADGSGHDPRQAHL